MISAVLIASGKTALKIAARRPATIRRPACADWPHPPERGQMRVCTRRVFCLRFGAPAAERHKFAAPFRPCLLRRCRSRSRFRLGPSEIVHGGSGLSSGAGLTRSLVIAWRVKEGRSMVFRRPARVGAGCSSRDAVRGRRASGKSPGPPRFLRASQDLELLRWRNLHSLLSRAQVLRAPVAWHGSGFPRRLGFCGSANAASAQNFRCAGRMGAAL